MPCVLPVLSLKLGKILHSSAQQTRQIRMSFLVSAAGIISGFIGLAIFLTLMNKLAMPWMGHTISAPYLFGHHDAYLGYICRQHAGGVAISLQERLASYILENWEKRLGYGRDFIYFGLGGDPFGNAMFGPFVGTAVGFAPIGWYWSGFLIFIALGFGLSLPFLLVATFPRLVCFLPKPGRWMRYVQWLLAGD